MNSANDHSTALRNKNYTYYAFISYKREDEKWAKWLKKRLQSYCLPTAICKRHKELPKRLSPVFLDKTNLRPGVLEEGLRSEVQSAKFLIVICSRAAHNNSKYLDLEIRHFLDGGGTRDRIIPFIVDSTSHPETDCFPLYLQQLCEEVPILGANIHEEGRNTALLKTISYMHGLKFEEMLPVEHKRRRHRILSIIVTSLFLLIGLAAGWEYYVPRKAYYLDYVERYGIPEGIHPLKKEELSYVSGYYTIIFKEHHPIELRYENQYGELAHREINELGDRPPMSVYDYRPDNTLERVTRYDENGDSVLVMEYINPKTVFLHRPLNEETYASTYALPSHSAFLTDNMYNNTDLFYPVKSGITRYLIDYYEQEDKKGLVYEVRYAYGDDYEVVGDADGVYGLRYDRDSYGRVIRTSYLTYTGRSGSANHADDYEVLGSRNGIFSVEFKYDAHDDLIAIYYRGAKNALVFSPQGYAYCLTKYDSHHNAIEESYWGTNEALVYNKFGVAQIVDTYDHGNRIQRKYLDIDGNLTYDTEYGVAKIDFEYNAQENKKVMSFFGIDGKPVLAKGGASSIIEVKKDNLIVSSAFGIDGKPVFCNGFSIIKKEYNENKKLVKISYFGTDGEPVLDSDWVHSLIYEYSNDQVKKVTCMNIDGTLTLSKTGYAIIEYEYDKRGNICYIRYLGTDGHPTIINEGCAAIERQWNDEGNLLRENYYDVNEKRTLNAEGYSAVKYEFKSGNPVRISFLGTEDEAVLCISEFTSVVEQDFDKQGNCVEKRFYDAHGELTFGLNGSAITRMEYDERGNNTIESYFDTDGKPVIATDGYAAVGQIFDDRGNIIQTKYYNTEGNVFRTKKGYAGIAYEYDLHGNLVKQTYLDEKGEPFLLTDGYTSIVWTFDAQDNLLQECYLVENFGLAIGPEGYAKVSNTYDAQSRLLEQAFYDAEGQLTSYMKYPEVHYIYYEEGETTELYDKDGKYSGGWREIFDERGRTIYKEFFNEDHASLGIKKYQYDERNNCVRESHYDENDQLVIDYFSDVDSFAAERSREYDARGNIIKTCYYDTQGKLRTTDYAILKQTYTEYNNVAESRYYAADGKLTLNNEGYAIYRLLSNDIRRKVEVRYYNAKEHLTNTIYGYAIWTQEYNEIGRVIREAYYDSDEKLTMVNGFAAAEREYDETGRLVRELRYDENEQLIEFDYKYCIEAISVTNPEDTLIIVSLGDWNYLPYRNGESIDEFVLNIERIGTDPTEYQYLYFNEEKGLYELKKGTFIRGKMGMGIYEKRISKEFFSEIIEAIESQTDTGM